ncbi:MAG: hypothetical protein V4481_02185 [Patescibacteria group bacterium]
MKNQQHLLVPLVLVVAAIVVGTSTIAVNYSQPADSSGHQAVNVSARTPEAVISAVSISANTAAAADAGSRIIQWKTTNYPANVPVTINLIEKVSDSPASYEFVRALAENTPNDGSEAWTPTEDEAGDTFYIEVVCASNAALSAGCHAGGAPVKAF